jgi:hypothetical protein
MNAYSAPFNASLSRLHVTLHQFVETRLVNRHDAVVEILDALLVHIQRDHLVAEIGKTRARDNANVTHTNDTNLFHTILFCENLPARGRQ